MVPEESEVNRILDRLESITNAFNPDHEDLLHIMHLISQLRIYLFLLVHDRDRNRHINFVDEDSKQ